MADVNDARHLDHEVAKERERLENADITDADRAAIEEFANYREGRVARNTLRQDMGNLRRAAAAAAGQLIHFERRSDVDAVMAALERAGVEAPESKNAYLRSLRQFFKFFGVEPGYPEYGWITAVEDYETADSRRLKAEDYLAEAEVTTIREAATHAREETLVEFAADTGARVNLICNLRRKDISLDGETPTFRPNPNATDGYKGVEIKPYPIHYAERTLRVWLNKRHTDPHPDAPLFPVKEGYDRDDRQHGAMHCQTAWGAIKQLADDTDIDRDRVNIQAFRHAAVRRMKMDPDFDFSWEAVKIRTAWSDQAFEEMKELYGALEAAEQIEYFAARAGRGTSEDNDRPPVFADCRVCGVENRRDASFCDHCGNPLDEDAQRRVASAEGELLSALRTGEVPPELVSAVAEELADRPDLFDGSR